MREILLSASQLVGKTIERFYDSGGEWFLLFTDGTVAVIMSDSEGMSSPLLISVPARRMVVDRELAELLASSDDEREAALKQRADIIKMREATRVEADRAEYERLKAIFDGGT